MGTARIIPIWEEAYIFPSLFSCEKKELQLTFPTTDHSCYSCSIYSSTTCEISFAYSKKVQNFVWRNIHCKSIKFYEVFVEKSYCSKFVYGLFTFVGYYST